MSANNSPFVNMDEHSYLVDKDKLIYRVARRNRIAEATHAAFITWAGDYTEAYDLAKIAIKYADALIAELDK